MHFTVFTRILQFLGVVGISYYQFVQQKIISCQVQGTCPRVEDFGVAQIIDTSHVEETEKILNDMVDYFKSLRSDATTTVMMHEMLDDCKNQDANCAFWAIVGECEKAPGYMKVSCAPVCQSCDQLSMEMRCPIDPDAETNSVWGPGSLNELFSNLTTMRENRKYKPHVLSKPAATNETPDGNSSCKIGSWVIHFDSFLSHSEAEKLVSMAGDFHPHYEGKKNSIEGHSNRKEPFSSTWLSEAASQDTTVKKIISRIERMTNIPSDNMENIQIVKYSQGQVHNLHHDYIFYQAQRQPGVRLLSIFIFLSDVEEGGLNVFPNLNVEIEPKKGRALIWPLVINESPNNRDDNMWYQIKMVQKGALYGANIFIHQRDFKGPNKNNCH